MKHQIGKKLRKPTIKEKKLADKVIIEGKSQGKAYMEVYGGNSRPTTARVEASRIMKRPPVEAYVEQALAKYDITVDRAVKVIDDALQAEKVNEFTGEITPDLQTRLKGSDRALKLLGVSKDGSIHGNTFNNFVIQSKNKYVED